MSTFSNLLTLLAFLFILPVYALPFISIDCGSSSPYHDPLGFDWVGDGPYVRSGVSKTIQASVQIPQPLRTLRAFTKYKKNCYSIPGIPVGTKVLLRATFYYGNYDGQSIAPTFDLQFDGNPWCTVATSAENLSLEEMIYVTTQENITVCLGRKSVIHTPFISTLEIRALDKYMYQNMPPNCALFTSRRLAFGAAESVRYPDDPYDRLWLAITSASADFTTLNSDSANISVNVSDVPPQAVMMHAITPSSKNLTSFGLVGLLPPNTSSATAYINLYFSELVRNQTDRSFEVFVDTMLMTPEPLVTPYGRVLEVVIPQVSMTKDSAVILDPLTKSKSSPLLNAFELFVISGELTTGTDQNDVNTLRALQTTYKQLQPWTGDPCLPSTFEWEWVGCSSDDQARVTALHLAEFGLSGTLPDFSALDALEIIDLNNNSLSGLIPGFLGNFPHLKELNLAYNDFSGSIPSSLMKENIKLNVTGNPQLEQPSNAGVSITINGFVIGGVALVSCILLFPLAFI